MVVDRVLPWAVAGLVARFAYRLALRHGHDLLEIDTLRRQVQLLGGEPVSSALTDSAESMPPLTTDHISFHGMGIYVRNLRSHISIIRSDLDPQEFELCKLLRKGDRCVLAGAGMGSVAVWACVQAGVENVLMYEAIPEKVDAFLRGVKVDGVVPTLRWGALSTRDGEANFLVQSEHWPGSSLLPNADDQIHGSTASGSVIRVPTVDTNRVLREWKANALMLDIEGEEHNVIHQIDLGPLRCIGMELHGSRQKMKDMCRFLIDNGFEIVYCRDHHPCPQQHIGVIRKREEE